MESRRPKPVSRNPSSRAIAWRGRAAGAFVGRDRELEALAARFDDARLVTLIGPGGVGKTRLALEFALAQCAVFDAPHGGGVHFVDLTDAASAADALAAVCAAIELVVDARTAERDLLEVVARHIASLGPCLIVLDNVEHIAAAIESAVSWFLRAAPSARFLVTSRVVLGVHGECELVLAPLAPDDATALFVERTRAVRAVSERELSDPVLRSIVEAIDRMPLAIELAASRTRVLTTDELLRRLERPLDVLRRASGDARHSSVRRAVLDSVALLDACASRCFALLSTFRNGVSLRAVEACVGEALPECDVLAAIETLARASLLRVHFDDGVARYALFETIREVANELRARDPAAERVRRAHAAHYAELARTNGDSSSVGVAPLERELDNLLAAASTCESIVETSADSRAACDLAAIALAIDPVLSRRGMSALREQLASAAVTALEADRSSGALLAEVLLARGSARRDRGDSASAAHDFNSALALAAARGLVSLEATATLRLAWVDDVRGATHEARARLERSLTALAQTAPSARRLAREAEALLQLAHADRREGSLDSARTSIEAARERYRALDDADGLCASLYESGVIAMFRGDPRAAFECFDQGLAVSRSAGIRLMEGACLTARGCLLQDLDRLPEALAHHAEAAGIFRSLGSRYREASALYYLATAYIERGEADEASRLFVDAKSTIAGVGAARYDVLMHSASALAFELRGASRECDIELDLAARALAIVPREPALGALVSIHRATIGVLRGAPATLSIDEASERVRAHPTDDTRFALRMFERAVTRSRREPAATPELRVWPACAAFSVRGAPRVELPSGSPQRRILEKLVCMRETTPGEPASAELLIQAGWPGERIRADAALNRLYVALATLRKRGLKDVLSSVAGGYAISRAVLVQRVQD